MHALFSLALFLGASTVAVAIPSKSAASDNASEARNATEIALGCFPTEVYPSPFKGQVYPAPCEKGVAGYQSNTFTYPDLTLEEMTSGLADWAQSMHVSLVWRCF
jgi:hypothetical protein